MTQTERELGFGWGTFGTAVEAGKAYDRAAFMLLCSKAIRDFSHEVENYHP